MEGTSRRGILGRHQSCDSERINIQSELEKSYMKKYACRPPPKMSLRHDWTKELVRTLIDNEKEKLLDNCKEKLPDEQNSSKQPNQFQIQFVKT